MKHLLCRAVLLGVLALLCFSIRASEPANLDPPLTPLQEYEALLAKYQAARKDSFRAYCEASTDAERQPILKKDLETPTARRLLELAQQYPKHPLAVDALAWVFLHPGSGVAAEKTKQTALAIFVRDHAPSEKFDPMWCQTLKSSPSPAAAQMLLAVLDKNPNRAVQAQACYSLANLLKEQAERARWRKQEEADAIEREAAQLRKRAIEQYGEVPVYGRPLRDIAKDTLADLRNPVVGIAAPPIDAEDAAGKHLRLSDHRGKVVVLHFWNPY